MEAGRGVDADDSSPKAAERAAGMESLKHLKNLKLQAVGTCTEKKGTELRDGRQATRLEK